MLRLYILIVVQVCALGQTEGPWNLIANQMPDALELFPAVGNGHVATQVYHDTLYVNNVFNGHGNDSHRARVPSPAAINITLDEAPSSVYDLNMYEGTFTRYIDLEDVTIQHRIYAHRSRTRLLVNEIKVERKVPAVGGDVVIGVEVNLGEPSMDMDLEDVQHSEYTWLTFGQTKEPELDDGDYRPIFMYWTEIPNELTFPEGIDVQSWRYLVSVSTENDDALESYEEAMGISHDDLFQEHTQAWAALWDAGHIEVAGEFDLAQTINACFYHILISCMTEEDTINAFAGLSPGGLARGGKITDDVGGPYNDYAGHVFWDMDTWIMPPLLMFYPELARVMIGARTRVIEAVRDYAQQGGYRGVRYPWEQAYSGYETCPWEPAILYQIHVTADVSYSIRQFLYVTEDSQILNEGMGAELAMDIARFWESRTSCGDEEKGCEIFGVMGPDEYSYNVNNSVFTNYNAKLSLELPGYLRDKLGYVFSPEEEAEIVVFNEIAENMFILFDEERQYHPQFEGFDPDDAIIKQSDVVLLGYPLMLPMTEEVRRNDLLIYEDVTDPTGPDTGTWSMHTVGWLELGNPQKAEEMFSMMFRNVNGPFKIFSEKPEWSEDGMRATNFITGMGGMLQSVVFGYAGIRVRMYQMDLDPYLLPNTQQWKLYGLKYRSSTLDMTIESDEVTVELTEQENDAETLFLVVPGEDEIREELAVNVPVVFARDFATIYAESDLPPKYRF